MIIVKNKSGHFKTGNEITLLKCKILTSQKVDELFYAMHRFSAFSFGLSKLMSGWGSNCFPPSILRSFHPLFSSHPLTDLIKPRVHCHSLNPIKVYRNTLSEVRVSFK